MKLFDIAYGGAALLHSLRSRGPRVIALYYHSVALDSPEISIDVSLFEEEMRFVAERCSPVSLKEIEAFVNGKVNLRDMSVAVTFDDGFRDNLTCGFPILERFRIPATIFVATGFVGKSVRYDEGERPALSWTEIAELISTGLIEIGSHTVSHPSDLCSLSFHEMKKEIVESKEILEEKLGKTVSFFSYPKGRMNGEAVRVVREANYSLGFSTRWAFIREGEERFAVPRIGSSNLDSLSVFQSRLKGGFVALHHVSRFIGANRG